MKVNFNDNQNRTIKNSKRANCPNNNHILNKNMINELNISSSLPKTNKTLRKYINQKLTSIKNNKKIEILNNSLNPKIVYKKVNFSPKRNISKKPKEKKNNLKQIKIYQKIYNKKNISKNENTNFNFNNTEYNIYKENDKYINSNIISAKRRKNSKQSKIVSSGSTSAGLSISSNKIEENARYTYYEYNINDYKSGCKSIIKNNNDNDKNIAYETNNINKRFILDESNCCKHRINNFNYETGSDDYLNENNILLKFDNNSSLTFGNSFSYSNSKRSKSTKRHNNNDENINNNLTFFQQSNNKNNNYINKLKEENEALKKELRESNNEISLLKYRIKELKEVNLKKNSRNVIYPSNLWNKRLIKYEILENGNNFNDFKNLKEFSLDLNINDKAKIKKIFFDKIANKTLNGSNFYENKKVINVKKNLNLKRKIHKKINEDYNSFCLLDKPCEKITECISKLKI